jgi:hypothetical protein
MRFEAVVNFERTAKSQTLQSRPPRTMPPGSSVCSGQHRSIEDTDFASGHRTVKASRSRTAWATPPFLDSTLTTTRIEADFIGFFGDLGSKIEPEETARRSAGTLPASLTRQRDQSASSGLPAIVSGTRSDSQEGAR